MTKVGHQAQAEYKAGYRYGLTGGEEPKHEKGKSFWLGWTNGQAERQENDKAKAG
jgi:hypothetical protein